MKLLIANERCDNLLKDTIALLEFLKLHKASLSELKVQVSNEVKYHTLVLSNNCIKGIDDIHAFFVKYFGNAPSKQFYRPPERSPESHIQDTDKDTDKDIYAFQRNILEGGDEDKYKPLVPSSQMIYKRTAPQQYQSQRQQQYQYHYQYYVYEEEVDIYSQLVNQFMSNGGD